MAEITECTAEDWDEFWQDTPQDATGATEAGREWGAGISDVRLIERAPREDEEPDEALARVIFGDAFGSHDGLRLAQLDVARAAREHIEAEEAENHPVGCGQMIRDVRDGDGFVTTIDGVMIAKTDSWNDLTERAEKAETALADERDRHDATITERDALRDRLDRLTAMTGMTPERLDAIRANLPTPDADLSRRERDAHDLLDEVDRLRAGIEDALLEVTTEPPVGEASEVTVTDPAALKELRAYLAADKDEQEDK